MSPSRFKLATEERGFSMLLAIVMLATVSILMYGAFSAIDGSAGTTRLDLDQKRALAAAYAGLSAYTESLNANENYWASCPTATNVTVPGSADDGSTERYSFHELVASSAPSNDNAACDSGAPLSTEIESGNASAGTFRVEFTGMSGPTSGSAQHIATRSIVAQFVPNRFLNYVYFTNYEELDPYAVNPTNPDTSDCDVYLWQSPARNTTTCPGIEFAPTDIISGPLYSNDEVQYCGSTTFGRSGQNPPDAIEAYSFNADGGSNCTGTPSFTTEDTFANGRWVKPLQLPPGNGQLEQVADGGNTANTNGCYANAGCVFTGPTTIVLGGDSMTVTNALLNSGTPKTYCLDTACSTTTVSPSNGVIYILDGSGACASYTPFGTDYSTTDNAGCGDATVSGSYNASLTIGADNDVIINGNLTTVTSGTALLGLIANDFVRVAHPVSGTCTQGNNSATNTTSGIYSTMTNPTIDAAILAVYNSFIVDNYSCGAALNTLTVYGAIAQDYRGPVATLGTSGINHGYTKQYTYDERLESLSPPYFLNPVDAGWQVQRLTSCGTTTSTGVTGGSGTTGSTGGAC
jgi:Tfp pilus assembly protein PilX